MTWNAPLSAYRFRETVTPRYADLDRSGCLSSAAQLGLFEEGNRSARRAMSTVKRAGGGVIAQHTVRHLAPATYPEPLLHAAAVVRLGNSSYEMQHLLVQDGRPVAVCNIIAVYLGETGRPTPLPEDFRRDLAAWQLLEAGLEGR